MYTQVLKTGLVIDTKSISGWMVKSCRMRMLESEVRVMLLYFSKLLESLKVITLEGSSWLRDTYLRHAHDLESK